MNQTDRTRLRKRLLGEPDTQRHSDTVGAIDLVAGATLAYTSESPDHPLEDLIFRRGGWASARPDVTARIVIEFDQPQDVSRLVYDVEERERERTQEIRLDVSSDNGRTYRQIFVQEYTFSPQGATFQHEDLRLQLSSITHLRLTIVPNKGGSGVATLALLQLFE